MAQSIYTRVKAYANKDKIARDIQNLVALVLTGPHQGAYESINTAFFLSIGLYNSSLILESSNCCIIIEVLLLSVTVDALLCWLGWTSKNASPSGASTNISGSKEYDVTILFLKEAYKI
jgi:hypothetical protein